MPPITKVREPQHLTVTRPELPADPALRAVAEDVLALCKYSFTAAAANQGPTTDSALDNACRDFIASRPSAARTEYAQRGSDLLEAPSGLRTAHFGRYASIGTEEFRSLGADGMLQKLGPPRIQAAQLRTGIDAMRTRLGQVATASKSNGTPQEFFHIDSGALQQAFEAAKKK